MARAISTAKRSAASPQKLIKALRQSVCRKPAGRSGQELCGWPGNCVDWKTWYRTIKPEKPEHEQVWEKKEEYHKSVKEICEELDITEHQYYELFKQAKEKFEKNFKKKCAKDFRVNPEFVLQYICELELRNLMHRGHVSCQSSVLSLLAQ